MTTREAVISLAKKGKSPQEIQAELGIKRSTVYQHHPNRKTRTSPHLLNPQMWGAFLLEHTEREPTGRATREERYYVNGRLLHHASKERRIFTYWTEEKRPANFWAADEFCVHVGLHISEYFQWCERQGLDAWLTEQPDWEWS